MKENIIWKKYMDGLDHCEKMELQPLPPPAKPENLTREHELLYDAGLADAVKRFEIVRKRVTTTIGNPNECEHEWVHLETTRESAERASIGYSSAKPWVRKDTFFCKKCLEVRIIKNEASLSECPDGAGGRSGRWKITSN